jgi:hypothetical protein
MIDGIIAQYFREIKITPDGLVVTFEASQTVIIPVGSKVNISWGSEETGFEIICIVTESTPEYMKCSF